MKGAFVLMIGLLISCLAVAQTCLAVSDTCGSTIPPNQNCTMLTPVITCASYTYEIINTSGSVVENKGLTSLQGSIYFLNFSMSAGDYIVKLCDDSTREISVKGDSDSMMIALAIIGVTILAFVIAVFALVDRSNIFMQGLKIFLLIISFYIATMLVALGLAFAQSSGASTGIVEIVRIFYQVCLWSANVLTAVIMLYIMYEAFRALAGSGKKKGVDE